MKVTIDNYQQIFASLDNDLSALENAGIGDVLKKPIKELKDKILEVRQGADLVKSENGILKIGVVGQVKAGKSSFLNSLFFDGENVLPRASTPMTAGLTVLQYGDENQFEVEYYNSSEWHSFEDRAKEYDDILKAEKEQNPSVTEEDIRRSGLVDDTLIAAKDLVSSCSRMARGKIQEQSKIEARSFSNITDLQDILEDYVGATGTYTPIVKCLTIRLKDERLVGVQIVDTPGVNDPVVSREVRTRDFLRGCHGVFFLSYSGRFFDSTDVTFLSERIGSQGIGTVVLIGSKFDSVLQDVGMKFGDDLGGAIEYCQRSLKKQFRNNMATSNYTGDDPIIDFSSGIGFSIAQKDEKRWDEIEAHVVKQMKYFYPSFFSSSKEIKEIFMNLSQIEDIRAKYVEGSFKGNKEQIIQNKVNAYFNNTNAELHKILSEKKERLENRMNQLKQSDINGAKERKRILDEVCNGIEMSLKSIRNRANEIADQYVKECLNNFTLSNIGKVSISHVSDNVTCKGRLWGSRTIQVEYDAVDIVGTIDNVRNAVDKQLDKLKSEWKSKSEDLRERIKKGIGEAITEVETKDKEGYLDGRELSYILEETLDAMSNKLTLDIRAIKKGYEALPSLLQGGERIPKKYDCKEAEAKVAVQREAAYAKERVVTKIRQFLSTMSDTSVPQELRNARESTLAVLSTKKDEFMNSVRKKTEQLRCELEQQLMNKEQELQMMEKVINGLVKIAEKL